MIGINVQENENIDKALKRFKKKYERSGVLKEYKKRTYFVKPSIEKRMEKIKAKRRAHKDRMRENFKVKPLQKKGLFILVTFSYQPRFSSNTS